MSQDRGGHTAFRAAMDRPETVTHLAVLDGEPILEALGRCDAGFAAVWWHWFPFAQPDRLERAVLADPEARYAGSAPRPDDPGHGDVLPAIRDPATLPDMGEDDRAGLGIDRRHDAEDRATAQPARATMTSRRLITRSTRWARSP